MTEDPSSDMQAHRRGTDLFPALAKAILLAAGVVVLLLLLHRVEPVLLASLLALILAVALNAPVTWLERRNVPRGIGTVITFAVVLVVMGVVGRLVVPRLAEEIPALAEEVPGLIQSLVDQVSAVTGESPEVERQMGRIVEWVLDIFAGLWRYTDVILGTAVMGIFIAALVLYLVANLRSVLAWYVASMPPRFREPAVRAFTRSSQMVIGWIVASVILGGIKAVAVVAFLTLMQIPGAVVWSVLAFFGAFVPRIGFYLMTIPPVVVALGVSPLAALWTLLFYVVFSEFLGNFVAPRIYQQHMDINAVFILFMTLAMGYGFGAIGVLIAAPVCGFVKAYYDEFYLARQPADPDLAGRVQEMVSRGSTPASE